MKDSSSESPQAPLPVAPSALASPLTMAAPKVGVTSPVTDQWNTKNLGWRLGADLLGAASAAVLVAPIISIIDRSIMENASGRRSLGASLRDSLKTLLLRPHRILLGKPFALIFMLYGGTYLTANTLDTATATVRNRPATLVTSGTTKFVASSTTNIGLCIYKDQVFVRLFGPPGAVPRPVPLPSYLLFAARDCMAIFASFNLPPLLGPALSERLGRDVQRYASGQSIVQFVAPAAIQFASTPLHLLGLDLYNRPAASGSVPPPTWADRWLAVKKNWLLSSTARIARIVPAFGVGGVVNYKVRSSLMEKLV